MKNKCGKSLIGALALMCLLLFAFAGCGETSVTADTDPADIVSQVVTEAGWDAAFANTEAALTGADANVSVNGTGVMFGNGSICIKLDAMKMYYSGSLGNSTLTDEWYLSVDEEADVSYRYVRNAETDVWSKIEMGDASAGREMLTAAAKIWSIVPLVENLDFDYDESVKGYKTTAEQDAFWDELALNMRFHEVIVKIVDDSVCYVKVTASQKEGNQYVSRHTIELKFYDYGRTSVTLPAVEE